MPQKIAIVNVFGANRGDEAMLSCLLHHLGEIAPNAQATVFSDKWLDLTRFEVAQRRWPTWAECGFASGRGRRLMQVLASRWLPVGAQGLEGPIVAQDVVISAPAGPYFGDLYRMTAKCLLPLLVAQCQGIPFGVIATSAGPFNRWQTRMFVRSVLKHAKLWTVREAISAKHLSSVGLKTEVRVGADLVFAHPRRAIDTYAAGGSSASLRKEIERLSERPTIVVTLNYTDYQTVDGNVARFNRDEYVRKMSQLLKHIADNTKAELLLVPHFYGNRKEMDVIEAVKEAVGMESRLRVLDPRLNAEAQMELYFYAEMAISHRYHPTIFAARAGCPFVCIRHQFKVDGMLEMLRYQGPVVRTNDDAPAWCRAFDEMWERRQEAREALRERERRMSELARIHLDAVTELLNAVPSSRIQANGALGLSARRCGEATG